MSSSSHSKPSFEREKIECFAVIYLWFDPKLLGGHQWGSTWLPENHELNVPHLRDDVLLGEL